MGSAVLPSLAENLLATLLALLAGPFASIAYRGIIQAFWWFSPILPNLDWSLKGLIGVVVPVIGLLVVRGFYVSQTQRAKARRSSGNLQVGWIVTAVISVALIWFSVGLFPIHPALVGSGSMSPIMDAGDIVLISKVPGSAIKVGDIIEFKTTERINIMHRVIAIEETGGEKYFVTKGDANSASDPDPVIPENVVGKVLFTLRKVGWIAVLVKGFIPF